MSISHSQTNLTWFAHWYLRVGFKRTMFQQFLMGSSMRYILVLLVQWRKRQDASARMANAASLVGAGRRKWAATVGAPVMVTAVSECWLDDYQKRGHLDFGRIKMLGGRDWRFRNNLSELRKATLAIVRCIIFGIVGLDIILRCNHWHL